MHASILGLIDVFSMGVLLPMQCLREMQSVRPQCSAEGKSANIELQRGASFSKTSFKEEKCDI